MSKTNRIEGLNPIVPPPADALKTPGILTEADVSKMEEVRFLSGMLPLADYATILIQIQNFCQWAANVGQNADLIGLEDFDLAIINTRHDGQNPGFVDAGASLVARSQRTGRYGIYDLVPPRGFRQDQYSRTTAFDLIAISRPEPPPAES